METSPLYLGSGSCIAASCFGDGVSVGTIAGSVQLQEKIITIAAKLVR